ncbi:MAG TPA: phosphate signaling complex protein PhoU [Verrucomicrobiae bacterium]
MEHFQQELTALKELLLAMASHAEAAVEGAVEAVLTRNEQLAMKVRNSDEVIDRYEIEVDEVSIRLLAKAPLATDLRFIAVSMKISQNLERVGDEATKIAKRARDLIQDPPLKLALPVREIADLSLRMLKTALDAFVNRDAASARALIPEDKKVDALNKEMHRLLTARMLEDPGAISRCLHLMVVVKSLERIADHAKNVAEEVVYLCEAEDIRHLGRSTVPSTGLPAS